MPRDAVIARSDVGVIGADHPLEGDPARQPSGAFMPLPIYPCPRRGEVRFQSVLKIAPGRMI